MLNVLIALLVFINAIFWLWTQNHLAILGWTAPTVEQGAAMAEVPIEPERIRPEHLGNDDDAPPSSAIDTTAAPAEWACWHLGPYSPSEQKALQNALPLNSDDMRWVTIDTVLPQRWVVASERTSSAKDLKNLVQEAKTQHLDHRTSESDVLRGRLILGTFINRDLAVNYLSNLLNQGWGPLSVLRERPPLPAVLLQVHVANDSALQQAQQAVEPIPVMGRAKPQVLACEDPPPVASAELEEALSPSEKQENTSDAPAPDAKQSQ